MKIVIVEIKKKVDVINVEVKVSKCIKKDIKMYSYNAYHVKDKVSNIQNVKFVKEKELEKHGLKNKYKYQIIQNKMIYYK